LNATLSTTVGALTFKSN